MSWDPTLLAALVTIVFFALKALAVLAHFPIDDASLNALAVAIVSLLLGVQIARGVKYMRLPRSQISAPPQTDHLDLL